MPPATLGSHTEPEDANGGSASAGREDERKHNVPGEGDAVAVRALEVRRHENLAHLVRVGVRVGVRVRVW